MVEKTWTRISDKYDEYITRYPDEGLLGGKLPLRDSILSGKGNYYEAIEGKLERECLIGYDSETSPIENLPSEIRMKLPIKLTQTLQVQVTSDNRHYWKTTYDTVDNAHNSHGFLRNGQWYAIRNLFHLSLCHYETINRPSHHRQSDYVQKVFRNTSTIAAYVSYPILEGYLKYRCRHVIERDGTVTQSNEIKKVRRGGYYEQGNRCSSLLDILVYFEENIANSNLEENLEQMREKIANFGNVGTDEAYGLIYGWRNSNLHGEAESDVQYGIVLNLLCLLIWEELIRNDMV
ncbi:hypothetical protein [Halalkalicoccus ordinarius]|uniref:hypothetical protein n=1 Tax=Halalkalicoccus ordinarius TaxID=3116651 RepID=UPI00300EF2E5